MQLQSKKKEDIPLQKCHVSCETIVFFRTSRVLCTCVLKDAQIYIYDFHIKMFKFLNKWTCTFSPLCTRCLLLHCNVHSYCLCTRGFRFPQMSPPKNQMFSERRKFEFSAYECENSRRVSNCAAWSSNIQRRQEDKHTFRSDQILILLHHSFMMSENSADVLKVAALWTLPVDTSRLGKTWKGSKPESTNVHSVLCGVDDISPEETSWISSFSSSPPPPSVPLLSLSFIFCLSLNRKWCNDAF